LGLVFIVVAVAGVVDWVANSPVYTPLVVSFVSEKLGGMAIANSTVSLEAVAIATIANANSYDFEILEDHSGAVMLQKGLERIGNVSVLPSSVPSKTVSRSVEIDLHIKVSLMEGMSLMEQGSVGMYFVVHSKVEAKPGFLCLSFAMTVDRQLTCGLVVKFVNGSATAGSIDCAENIEDIHMSDNSTGTKEFVVRLPADEMRQANLAKNLFFGVVVTVSSAFAICLASCATKRVLSRGRGEEARDVKAAAGAGHGKAHDGDAAPDGDDLEQGSAGGDAVRVQMEI